MLVLKRYIGQRITVADRWIIELRAAMGDRAFVSVADVEMPVLHEMRLYEPLTLAPGIVLRVVAASGGRDHEGPSARLGIEAPRSVVVERDDVVAKRKERVA